MKVSIKSFDIGTAFKVGAMVSGLTTAVFIGPMLLLQFSVLGLASVTSVSTQSGGQPPVSSTIPIFGAGIVGLICLYGFLVVIYAIFGGIGAAVSAFVYNLTSRWVGGLQIDLERIREGDAATPNPKRTTETDIPDPDTA